MTDDLLRQATAALREQGDALDSGARTRARVLLSLHERKRRRRTRWALGAPLLILFAGSTAWASASGKLPQVVQVLTAPFTFTSGAPPPEAAAQKPASRKTSGAPTPAAAPVAPPLPEAPPLPAEPLDDAPAAPIAPAPKSLPPALAAAPVTARGADRGGQRAPGAASSAARRAANPPEAIERASEPPDALSLYRSAHRAHFVERDPAAALAGYEAYLAAAPNGRFALEARYNRALCLVRVGRHAEARAALAPFAQGRFDGYRQDEARRLIDATGGDAATR